MVLREKRFSSISKILLKISFVSVTLITMSTSISLLYCLHQRIQQCFHSFLSSPNFLPNSLCLLWTITTFFTDNRHCFLIVRFVVYSAFFFCLIFFSVHHFSYQKKHPIICISANNRTLLTDRLV